MANRRFIKVNFSKSKIKPVGICLHTMVGTLKGTDSWFRNPKARASSHYGIGLNGKVYQWVKESDRAWAQGSVYRPTARLVKDRPKKNPNTYLISIEHEDKLLPHKVKRTTKMYKATAKLVADICKRHKIPIARTRIIGHREIYAKKSCPGNLDINKIVKMAKEMSKPKPKVDPCLKYKDKAQNLAKLRVIDARVIKELNGEVEGLKVILGRQGEDIGRLNDQVTRLADENIKLRKRWSTEINWVLLIGLVKEKIKIWLTKKR